MSKYEYALSMGECEKCERKYGCLIDNNMVCRFAEMSHDEFISYFEGKISAYDAVIKSIEEELNSWKRNRQLKVLLEENDEGELIKV